MKRILIVGTYAVGGLVLAGAVSLGAFAVTARQLSETPEPVGVGRSVTLAPTADDQGGGGVGNGQGGQHDDWSPSWSPAPPSDSPSSSPGGGDDISVGGDDHSSSPSSGSDDHSSGSGSGDESGGDSSGSGDGDADDD
ncbi:MAG: hypothetical protein ACXWXN_10990 [Actinomycetota bacterium]